MDSSILRSRLSNTFSELQFLSTQELDECKWPVIQRVFSLLFEKSASLRQYSEQIFDLTDLRNQELQRRRTNSENREHWKDSNANFKTGFLRIIIDGLSLLRWPPSLVAFSDPLEAVLSNPKDAIAYLLEFGISKEINRHTRITKNEISRNIPRSPRQDRYENNRQTHHEHPHEFQHNASPTSDSRVLNASYDDGKSGQFSSFYSDETSEIQGPESTHLYEEERNCKPASRNHNKKSGNREILEEHEYDNENNNKYESKNENKNENRKIDSSFSDLRKFRQSFEILQHQNEVLSRQLKHLQDSINVRDRVENSIGNILSDFKATIDEIVNIPKNNKNDKNEGTPGYHIPQLSKNPILTKTLDEEFKEEIEREKIKEKETEREKINGKNQNQYENQNNFTQSALQKKKIIQNRVINTNNTQNGNSLNIPFSGSAIIFIKLQTKLKNLENEWNEARKNISNSFFDTIDPHNKCDHYLNSDSTEINKNKNKNIKNHINTNIESNFNNNNCWDGDGRPKTGSREIDKKFSYSKNSKNINNAENDKNISLSCKIRTHQILGVKAPLSGPCDDSQIAPHGLDLSRIHLLQRDLISFSETAFSFFSQQNTVETEKCTSNIKNNTNAKNCKNSKNENDIIIKKNEIFPDLFPFSYEESEKQKLFYDLYEKSQNLILHLSCLAPLSPLVLTSPYNSSRTGLELIQNEINILYPHQPTGSGQRAQAAIRLQGIIDRIKSEQVNLIRSLQCSNSMLHQWTSAAARTVPLFSTYGKNLSDSSLKSRQDIFTLCGSLNLITDAMAAAEESRIAPPLGHFPLTSQSKSRSDTKTEMKTRMVAGSAVGTGAGVGTRIGVGSGTGVGLGEAADVSRSEGRPTSARPISRRDIRSDSINRSVTDNLSTFLSVSESESESVSQSMGGVSLQPLLISPMNSLAKGCMGGEIATFIDTLRMYIDDVKLIPPALEGLKSQLIKDNNKELKIFENAKKNILFASKTTEQTIEGSTWHDHE